MTDITKEVELSSIPGIGPKAVESLAVYAGDEKAKAAVNALLREVVVMPYNDAAVSGGPGTDSTTSRVDSTGVSSSQTMDGKHVLITGKLKAMSRKDAQELCLQQGDLYDACIMFMGCDTVVFLCSRGS